MDFKKFWNDSFWAFALKNIIAALALVAVLIFVVFYSLDKYTHHGEAVEVPELRGLYEGEADVLLHNSELHYQIVDSTYDKHHKLGTILEQTPGAGTMVKKGRSIYLIVNSKTKRQVPVPEVRDLSCRQAEAILRTLSIKVGEVIRKPAEYQDLVLDLLYKGEALEAGTRIEEDSQVTLVIGETREKEMTVVPNVKGMSLSEARETLLSKDLVVGMADYDVEPSGNEFLYRVYRQSISGGRQVEKGKRVDLFLTSDPNKVQNEGGGQNVEDEFF